MQRFRYLPLTPPKWPQDHAQIPAGLGGMPPVEYNNAARTEAEFFALNTELFFPNGSNPGFTVNGFIPTPQDGDFWADQISVITIIPGQTVEAVTLFSTIAISDVRTGKQLTYDAVQTSVFAKFVTGPNASTSVPSPSFFRATGTMMQPYCFTRQGGIKIQVILTSQVNTDATLSVGLSGWKEYANASH